MKTKKNNGFTLIEILVVTALLAIIMTTSVQLFTFTLRNNEKARAVMEIKQLGDNALSVMASKIRLAKAITTSCSLTGVPASSITITNNDFSTTTFACSDTEITQATTSSVKLISQTNIAVNNPTTCFTCYSVAGGFPNIIEIKFGLTKNPSNPILGATLNFSTTVSLRNY